MKQNVHTVKLWGYLPTREGWGRKAGAAVAQKVRGNIDSQKDVDLVRLSLQGVRKLDVTFAGEALVGLVAHYRSRIPVCLTELSDEDVVANVAAAARKASVPVTVWNAGAVTVLGPMPRPALRPALDFALARSEVRGSDLARELAISTSNASSRLKALCDEGFIARRQHRAASGGIEHVYCRMG